MWHFHSYVYMQTSDEITTLHARTLPCLDAWMLGCLDACMLACLHACMLAYTHRCVYTRTHITIDVCMIINMNISWCSMFPWLHASMLRWFHACMLACWHASISGTGDKFLVPDRSATASMLPCLRECDLACSCAYVTACPLECMLSNCVEAAFLRRSSCAVCLSGVGMFLCLGKDMLALHGTASHCNALHHTLTSSQHPR